LTVQLAEHYRMRKTAWATLRIAALVGTGPRWEDGTG